MTLLCAELQKFVVMPQVACNRCMPQNTTGCGPQRSNSWSVKTSITAGARSSIIKPSSCLPQQQHTHSTGNKIDRQSSTLTVIMCHLDSCADAPYICGWPHQQEGSPAMQMPCTSAAHNTRRAALQCGCTARQCRCSCTKQQSQADCWPHAGCYVLCHLS
jgi:hypothetical protein